MKRSTIDIVVIIFASMVALELIISVAGVLFIRINHPEIDTSRAGETIAGITTTIVGALVGFIGGRATGRAEANGANKT